ncbi:MAG TPA: dihydroneopterin aldolase [Bacteroidales bacterium]|jgi:dihydroneopterin aldolase|nr:dihydroneopterin aldolase [Bacteroidales bacterium]
MARLQRITSKFGQNRIKMDYLILKGLRFYAHHGVFNQERMVGNTFTVDLKLGGDFTLACQTDTIDNALNYGDVYKTVAEVMAIPSNLLEHVAERICQQLKATYPMIINLEVTVTKTNPPLVGEMESASVVLTR